MPAILIAEHTGVLEGIGGTYLRRGDYELVSVGDGREAIEKALALRPALIILDTAMVAPDGLVVCATIKADPALRSIPVILVGNQRDREAGRQAGADEFVSRPVALASLLAHVRPHLPAPERSASRRPVSLKVTCSSGEESFVAFTRDLSSTGLFLKSARPPRAGSRLSVSFALPGGRAGIVRSEAEVVRAVAGGTDGSGALGAGLRFTSLPAETRIEIARYVREGGWS